MARDRLQSPFGPPDTGLPADDRQRVGRAAHLLTNPADDDEFSHFAHAVLRRVRGIDAFETALHERYPSAAVHERVISGEPWLVWYVYRDGHWVSRSPSGGEEGRHGSIRRSVREGE